MKTMRHRAARAAAPLGFFAAALLCAALPAAAQAPALPAPEAVALDRLGYMKSFPPQGEQLIDQSNRGKYPQMRWVLQHTRELGPTRNIRRGSSAPSPLPRAERNLDEFAFDDDKGQPTTIGKWQRDTYTDALVVLHKGQVVYERYHGPMRPETPHLLFSITKSFTGLLAAQLAHEGRIDPQAPVTKYVPELADSAWAT